MPEGLASRANPIPKDVAGAAGENRAAEDRCHQQFDGDATETGGNEESQDADCLKSAKFVTFKLMFGNVNLIFIYVIIFLTQNS